VSDMINDQLYSKTIGFTSRVAYVKFPIRQRDIILDM